MSQFPVSAAIDGRRIDAFVVPTQSTSLILSASAGRPGSSRPIFVSPRVTVYTPSGYYLSQGPLKLTLAQQETLLLGLDWITAFNPSFNFLGALIDPNPDQTFPDRHTWAPLNGNSRNAPLPSVVQLVQRNLNSRDVARDPALQQSTHRFSDSRMTSSATSTTTRVIRLLAMPEKVLISVLFHLPYTSLLDCRLTHPTLRRVIDTSAVLQYNLELAVAGFEDNVSPTCKLGVDDRLRLLKSQESAWGTLSFGENLSISKSLQSDGIHLIGGILMSVPRMSDALNFIKLPSNDDRDVSGDFDSPWSKIGLGSRLYNVGHAIQEHDLVAMVTCLEPPGFWAKDAIIRPNDKLMFDVHLLKLSTGTYHPLATRPVIRVSELPATTGTYRAHIEIVGNILGILLSVQSMLDFQDLVGGVPVELYMIDWRTGDVLMKKKSPPMSYNSFVFLSEDAIVLPDRCRNVLELCRIQTRRPTGSTSGDSTTRPAPLPLQTACTLALPYLNRDFEIDRLLCRSEPNPYTQPHPATSRPFHPAAREATVIFSYVLRERRRACHPQWFSLIVHRATLLELLAALSPLSSPDPDLVRSTYPRPIPWASWGPPKSRWFAPSGFAYRWTTCGQRHAVIGFDLDAPTRVPSFGMIRPVPNFGSGPKRSQYDGPITVFNFNQLALRRYVSQKQRGGDNGEAASDVDIEVVNHPTEFNSPFFAERIVSALPYMRVTTRKTYDYSSLSMDEERIMGLKDGKPVIHYIRAQ